MAPPKSEGWLNSQATTLCNKACASLLLSFSCAFQSSPAALTSPSPERRLFDSNFVSVATTDWILIFLITVMAARILANIIIMGSGIMARAFAQAYRQALTNASKNGVAQEAVQNIKRVSKTMTEAEARQVLGVAEHSSWEDVLQKYDNLFESNAKNGSFYLQSKVHRAKECLESLYQSKTEGPN